MQPFICPTIGINRLKIGNQPNRSIEIYTHERRDIYVNCNNMSNSRRRYIGWDGINTGTAVLYIRILILLTVSSILPSKVKCSVLVNPTHDFHRKFALFHFTDLIHTHGRFCASIIISILDNISLLVFVSTSAFTFRLYISK